MSNLSTDQFNVRDQRKAGHHWADNEVIDDFGTSIGAYGYCVYMFICRHAGNRDGRCHKTQGQIAEAFGISPDTVGRAIRKLVDAKLISFGKQIDNTITYYVLEVPKHTDISGNPLPPTAARVPPTAETLPPTTASNKEERLSLNFTKTNPLPPLEKPLPSAPDQQSGFDIYSAAKSLGELIGMSTRGKFLHALVGCIEQAERRWKDRDRYQVVLDIAALWKEYRMQGHHAPIAIHNWVETVGRFIDSDDWKKKNKESGIVVDEHGGHYEGTVYVTKEGRRLPGYKPLPRKPEGVQ